MRMIDADALNSAIAQSRISLHTMRLKLRASDIVFILQHAPTIDAVPVAHYQDTGSTVIKAEDINEWQSRIIIDEGESHSCAIYYKEGDNTVDVVRCKDCKHSQPIYDPDMVWCNWWKEEVYNKGFCHMGLGGEADA